MPAADFAADELLYLPRNMRSHRLYGFSPVEQIALTIDIALRREQATLDYYNTGSIPDSFATLPKDWTVDQIRQFHDYFDALRRMQAFASGCQAISRAAVWSSSCRRSSSSPRRASRR